MELMSALGGIGAAFGLSTSAGLNAYIPLLVVALAAKFSDSFHLSAPYDALTSWWVIGILAVLLLVEMFVDKIPAVDSINDIIQTFIRPVAGAVLFAANANVVTDVSPIIALVAGLLVAGGVHATKGAFRPAVTATTAGTGNWLVSILEDIVAFVMSLLALILPILIGIGALLFIALLVVYFIRRRRKQEKLAFN
ncbi:MAG: DUF4126 domain-containing protein [Ardenticatenales bacterium]|nr:DUF4126 domain-containing protein [Ardenticatenales bacterium]